MSDMRDDDVTRCVVCGGVSEDGLCDKHKYDEQPSEAVQAAECVWSEAGNYGDTWGSSCGSMFTFTDDGPKENNMQFCNNCGGKVVVNGKDN